MATVKFTKQDFENALPKKKDGSGDAWIFTGQYLNEFTYSIPLWNNVAIHVRSSVSTSTGVADGTGEDSIRYWLAHGNDRISWNVPGKWTTREPGWEDRLLYGLRKLALIFSRAGNRGMCPKCGKPLTINRAKRQPRNVFAKCEDCDVFEWIDEE